jgi:hypothetical protein
MADYRVLSLTIQLKTTDVWCYLMYTAFRNRRGVLRLLLSVCFFAIAYFTRNAFDKWFTLLLCLFGILNPVISPILFWVRACGTVRQASEYCFHFEKKGFNVYQGKESAFISWESVKTSFTSSLIIFSIDGQKAFIIPRLQIDAQTEKKLVQLIN